MPIRAYLSAGASFSPEAVVTMGEAFEATTAALRVAAHDHTKREQVAKLILQLAREQGALDAPALRGEAVAALHRSAAKDDPSAVEVRRDPRSARAVHISVTIRDDR